MRVGFFPAVAVERFSALHIDSEEPHFLCAPSLTQDLPGILPGAGFRHGPGRHKATFPAAARPRGGWC